jgi:archaeal preflagellin peptidase FlaK
VSQALLGVQIALLVGGLGYAALSDLRTREVTDRLWQVLGVVGWGLGAVWLAPGGILPVALWLLVGGLTIQHMFPWDDALGKRLDRFADLIEGVAYLLVILVVLVASVHWGIGTSGVPLAVIALLATMLFARGLFELGVLYGGADAKALMVAGLLLPLLPTPFLPQTAPVALLLTVLPFPVNLLVDAAVLSLAVPVAIAVRNVARREFEFPRGFTGYMIPVKELPDRFVWLKDPLLAEEEDAAETSEEDREIRVRAAHDLEAKGVERVWVTPQIPFVVLLALGAVAALLAGNLLLDLFAAL